jgi:hypothetical protein
MQALSVAEEYGLHQRSKWQGMKRLKQKPLREIYPGHLSPVFREVQRVKILAFPPLL